MSEPNNSSKSLLFFISTLKASVSLYALMVLASSKSRIALSCIVAISPCTFTSFFLNSSSSNEVQPYQDKMKISFSRVPGCIWSRTCSYSDLVKQIKLLADSSSAPPSNVSRASISLYKKPSSSATNCRKRFIAYVKEMMFAFVLPFFSSSMNNMISDGVAMLMSLLFSLLHLINLRTIIATVLLF